MLHSFSSIYGKNMSLCEFTDQTVILVLVLFFLYLNKHSTTTDLIVKSGHIHSFHPQVEENECSTLLLL